MKYLDIPVQSDELGHGLLDDLFPIERDIVHTLFELGQRGFGRDAHGEWTNKTWTREVKTALHELGHKEGFLVYPEKTAEGFTYEWLLDVTWINAKFSEGAFDWRYSRGLRLAAESEWSSTPDRILEDFYKLTFVLADVRLFIYTNSTVRPNSDRRHPVELCRGACPLSRGFRYLLVGFPNRPDGNFRVDGWIA